MTLSISRTSSLIREVLLCQISIGWLCNIAVLNIRVQATVWVIRALTCGRPTTANAFYCLLISLVYCAFHFPELCLGELNFLVDQPIRFSKPSRQVIQAFYICLMSIGVDRPCLNDSHESEVGFLLLFMGVGFALPVDSKDPDIDHNESQPSFRSRLRTDSARR